jgi:methylthioribulose 1-phosphate dehydratase/enolase-phosphatase E1
VPSLGVPKERIQPEELYVLNMNGDALYTPPPKYNSNRILRPSKLSDSAVLFVKTMQLRANTHCVLHSHALATNLITQLSALTATPHEFRASTQEMIKGLAGHGFYDELVIPIIENTAFEYELTDTLADAITRYPQTHAILVRNHGLYVWGETWEVAKRHAECLHYLFDLAVEMHKCGLGPSAATHVVQAVVTPDTNMSGARKRNAADAELMNGHSHNNKQCLHEALHYQHYIFDIEGTTTPITFVKDVLFPYARSHLREYLTSTWTSQLTQADVQDILAWAKGLLSAPSGEDTNHKIDFLVTFLEQQIDADSKHGALKQLQGHMWKLGYESGALKSCVFDDVLPSFQQIIASGSRRVSIYSSGSRQAQHLLFKYTQAGDLRGCISNYFDTTVGNKRDPKSYENILLTLGYDSSDPTADMIKKEVCFVTDILEEAQAAEQAGMTAVLSIRVGNAPVAEGHGFKMVTSFAQLD